MQEQTNQARKNDNFGCSGTNSFSEENCFPGWGASFKDHDKGSCFLVHGTNPFDFVRGPM